MRAWIFAATALIAAGLGIFLYKVFRLGYPLSTAEQPGVWRFEQVLSVSGRDGRVVVNVSLPRTSPYQRLVAEEVRSANLRFSIQEERQARWGRWSGKLDGSTTLRYQATIEARSYHQSLPQSETTQNYPKSVRAYLQPSDFVQADDTIIADLSRELLLSPRDKVKLARELFDFVAFEIGSTSRPELMDAVTVVREGRGNASGRATLFCALARHNQLPCRVVSGVILHRDQPQVHYWNELYIGGAWVPFDCWRGTAERLPPDRVALSMVPGPLVESTGTTALSYRFYTQPEILTYSELVRRRIEDSEHLFDRVSLLLLPVHAQRALRLLLLVPLGALAMCVIRNVIGIRTFGTFMPMLIALAMTNTGLRWGTAFLIVIIGFALLSRLWIQRLYLLFAARIAFILTLIVMLMAAVLMVGDRLGFPASGVEAFPFVIMTMIVERISVALEEEGLRNTVNRILSTLSAIYLTYAVIRAPVLQSFFLVYPEMLLVILGLLVAVGRYTGYRVIELIRFRELIAAEAVKQRSDALKPQAGADQR